jgi:hypothetical protein
MAIWMEAAQQRKGRSVDAIKKSNEHPLVINAVGRLFWNERKIEKTRLWLGRAANADPDNGDLWAWWYKFEKQHGEKVRFCSRFAWPLRLIYLFYRSDKTKLSTNALQQNLTMANYGRRSPKTSRILGSRQQRFLSW